MMSGGHPGLADALSGAAFAVFLALGLLAAAARRRPRTRAAANVFLAYSLAVSLYAGLKQRDGWPFAPWPIVAVMPRPKATVLHVLAVDAAGAEHEVDYRAWQPIGYDELVPWVMFELPRLERAERDRAAAYLLDRAEQARQRVRAGGRPGHFDRWLGPLTAPYFLLHPKRWTTPDEAPAAPFLALRIYYDTWSLDARRPGGDVSRDLSYEYRRP